MQMQMSLDELKSIQPNEGIVIGSVHIKGGKDLLGRTKWNLAAEQTNNAGGILGTVSLTNVRLWRSR